MRRVELRMTTYEAAEVTVPPHWQVATEDRPHNTTTYIRTHSDNERVLPSSLLHTLGNPYGSF
jgi:hypothetical protein